MADLLFHIGMGKTGSSYLQALMRMSRGVLAEKFAISYPPRNEARDLAPAAITSGNGEHLLDDSVRFAAELDRYAPHEGTCLLFSSEQLCKVLGSASDLAYLPETARAAGFERVRILLFVRDPIALFASLTQQRIKRSGYTGTVEELIVKERHPEVVADLLDRLDALDGVETTVRNYTTCSKRLLETFADWLGVPVDALVKPGVERINRSLTRGELELQRAFNRVVRNTSGLISDPLCERLPDMRADEILPSVEVQAEVLERLAPVLERISRRLPPREDLSMEVRPPHGSPEELVFTPAQLAVLAESLGGELARLRQALTVAQQQRLDKASLRQLTASVTRRAARRLRRLFG